MLTDKGERGGWTAVHAVQRVAPKTSPSSPSASRSWWRGSGQSRRANRTPAPNARYADLVMDLASHSVTRNGTSCTGRTEFRLCA